MDYTQNLHLPQWEETDRIHHDDFNDAFQTLDAAVPRIAVGTYTGDGVNDGKTITLDFPIKAVFIWMNDSTASGDSLWPHAALCTNAANYTEDLLMLSGSSFTVRTRDRCPRLNTLNRLYYYFAIG